MNHTTLIAFVGAAAAVAIAAIAALRERRSTARWTFVAGMLALAIESALTGLSAGAHIPAATLWYQTLKMTAMALLPGTWILFCLIYALGDYRKALDQWRWLVGIAFVTPVALAIGCRSGLIVIEHAGNTGTLLIPRLGWSGVLLHTFFLFSILVVLMNLERTFRASVGTMRWRIKFMILGLGVLFAVRAYTTSQILLFRHIDLNMDAVNSGALLVACLLMLRSLLRSGQSEVTIYPSHSVLHNSLTVLLAGIYLLIVGVFAKVVSHIGGDAAFALKTFLILFALVLLTVLLLSDRMRLRLNQFISRHFQRPMYDYRTVWRRFTEATASHTGQTELCRATVRLAADIFQSLSVTIWLVDEKKEKLCLAASTSLSEGRGEELSPAGSDVQEVLRALREHGDVVDIDSSKQKWAETLRRCHPGEFRQGGSRICVPMVVGGEVIGLLMLGDRVGGVPFLQQDFDLLKCVGDQAAASLHNAELSQKLLLAREHEAFQTMSTFFVHDLKNTASTLNLMLKNLPVHFDDPAFREDALRGVAKTVTHINDLISRLSALRHGLEIRPADSDLNELAARAVADWSKAAEVDLVTELSPLPKVRLDQDQMLKVVTNLVLNAKEAVPPNGRVRVTTNQANGWAVLTVADNGRGMSPEFLRRSLFRPFQTTKKNGIGIGMFQSKMIVEAHRGRIEAESELGKGTTFRVFLPLQAQA